MSALSIGAVPSVGSSGLDELLFDLHLATDLERLWRSNLRLISRAMPYHSCSLMLGITEAGPSASRHHVVADPNPAYQPTSSLTVSADYLARHPRVKLYTFSHVLSEDPRALQRRVAQEGQIQGNWNEFVHLAFWNRSRPDAVLSVRRSPCHGGFLADELALLDRLHPAIDAALHRLRSLEQERAHRAGLEHFLTGLPMPILFLDFDQRLQFATQEGFDACAAWNLGPKRARGVNSRRAYVLPPEIAEACAQIGVAAGQGGESERLIQVPGMRVPHPTNEGLVARVTLGQPVRGPWAKPGFFVTFVAERNGDGARLPMPRSTLDHLRLLSPSERRVALLVTEGLTNSAIAERLSKSERTVESQLNAIYRKLGGINRVQLVRLLQ